MGGNCPGDGGANGKLVKRGAGNTDGLRQGTGKLAAQDQGMTGHDQAAD
ncbi:hypothetical protein [Roseibium sp. TrichSKD4]|nr:hypothetical protein [Roseibium sp. TrichSKD4]